MLTTPSPRPCEHRDGDRDAVHDGHLHGHGRSHHVHRQGQTFCRAVCMVSTRGRLACRALMSLAVKRKLGPDLEVAARRLVLAARVPASTTGQ